MKFEIDIVKILPPIKKLQGVDIDLDVYTQPTITYKDPETGGDLADVTIDLNTLVSLIAQN